MKLAFPNPSRSFDETKNRVCFWGYDSTIEITFFVELDALQRLCPDMGSIESAFLQTFDKARSRIYEVARKAYEKSRGSAFSFILVADDF
jgi:hypothetical protein